jgi:hypothetical protein
MNAIKFIKQHGIDKAREELQKLPNSNITHMTNDARMFVDKNNPLLDEFQRNQIKDLICIDDLKRLVESVDLINRMGDLIQAKLTKVIAEEIGYKNDADALRQAIADYESIYSNDMGDDAHKAI